MEYVVNEGCMDNHILPEPDERDMNIYMFSVQKYEIVYLTFFILKMKCL